MTMKSSNLLPALRSLPTHPSSDHRSFRDIITDLVNTDRAFYAAEVASATSFGLWGVFDDVNVDDEMYSQLVDHGLYERLTEAYRMQYPNEFADHSLHEKWLEVTGRGEESAEGLIHGLKGKLAEIEHKEWLEQNGYTDVQIALSPNQPVWDISATSPEGEVFLAQVKTGAAERAGEIESLMVENLDVHYAVSTEIYDRIAERSPDLIDQMTNIGTYEFVGDATDALSTLSGNLGIDVPDGVVDIVPYAGAVLAGARLVYSVLQTEKQFSAADRTTKNKIQVVQSLTLMSRMGVTTILATVGGAGGTAAGSAIPGVGNLVGGIVGTVAGAGMGMYLNKHLEPRILDLALDITNLTRDDLFYYKNKIRIDQVALSFRQTAIELGPASTP